MKDPNTHQLTHIESRGQFNAVYELNGQLYATGVQNLINCDSDESNPSAPILLIADAKTGDALPEYPLFKETDVTTFNGTDYDIAVNLLPVMKNGISEGTVGIGKIVPHGVNGSQKAVVFLLNNDGTLNTNFGTDGYFIGPDNTKARQLVKIDNPSNDVHYIVIGEIANSATDYNVYVDALTEDGKLASSWNEKYFSESILGSLYTDITSEDAPICSSPGSYFENSIEWGWDVAQSGTSVYLSCIFDGVDNSIQNFYTQVCPEIPNGEAYSYKDIALIKLDLEDGKVLLTVNVGVSEAFDFYPDLEVKDGRVCVIGAKSHVDNGEVITDGKLSEFDEDLHLVSEKIFSSHTASNDWDINCSFDLAFTCDDEIMVCGNNDINDEDYYFYKFSNGCQQNVETNSTDITSRHVVNGTEVWDDSKKVMDKVIVPTNATLEITNNNPNQDNTIIEFGSSWELTDYDELAKNQTNGKEPRIVVESGGHLILNNCFLRGLLGCSGNSMWDGIEVQEGGLVEMHNANISNARYGILASRGIYNESGTLTPNNSTGGSVDINGSSIVDCEYGIYLSRTSTPPEIVSTELLCTSSLPDPRYKTYIEDNPTPFDKTQGLGTRYFVYAYSNSDIHISGGNISNTGFIPAALRGTGVYSWFSKLNIDGITISNLYAGIDARAAYSNRFYSVSNSNFNNNVVGIIFKSGNLHMIHDNAFICSYPTVPGGNDNIPGIGIYKAAVTKTKIEDNDFTASVLGTQSNSSLGIVSENTSSASSLHRHNTFTSIGRGDQAQMLNPGLNLWCNEYTNTNKAWAINISTNGNGAFRDQGECVTARRLYPDNKFFDNCDPQSPVLKHAHSNLGFTYWRNDESNYPKVPCSQNMTLNSILSDCASQGALISGCYAPTPITSGNADEYLSVVPTLPEGEERGLLVNDLLRYYYSIGDIITVKILLSNESDINYKISYALILLEEDNFSAAQAVVNNMPSSSSEKADFVSVFNVIVYSKQNNLNLSDLPETQLNSLESLEEGRSLGAYQAQALLSQYYSRSYPLIIENESELEFRSRNNLQTGGLNDDLIILPNPVEEEMTVRLSNLHLGIKEISVITSAGIILIQRKLDGRSNSINLRIDQLDPGLYLIQIKDQNNELRTAKIIKY
ncbi:MAG: T9SS type A sorting domain-containing protein [Saprospiraceae bacterium]